MTALKTYLQSMVAARKQLQATPGVMFKPPEGIKYCCAEEFVLDNGISYPVAPRSQQVKRGRAKECFANATRYALGREPGELTYCEGFAMTSRLGIAVHHAWLLTAAGEVVEPTWEWAADTEYCGVPVPNAVLADLLVETGYYGVLMIDGMHTRVVLGTHPRFPYKQREESVA